MSGTFFKAMYANTIGKITAMSFILGLVLLLGGGYIYLNPGVFNTTMHTGIVMSLIGGFVLLLTIVSPLMQYFKLGFIKSFVVAIIIIAILGIGGLVALGQINLTFPSP